MFIVLSSCYYWVVNSSGQDEHPFLLGNQYSRLFNEGTEKHFLKSNFFLSWEKQKIS